MTITTYPDGHSVQQGTPEELAQFIFAATEVQTLQKIQKSGRGNPGGNGETKGYCGDDTGFAKEEANAKKESGKRK